MGRIGILARHDIFASFSGPILRNHNHVAYALITSELDKISAPLILSELKNASFEGSEFKHASLRDTDCLALLCL